ncbi:CaiB/BaiF CoA transferase family protein [Nocardioides sp.]|uniref:CaiB/BaiF CoA transferase family protein n=1 Tax=Nocardioides sp. TaxID=35761 RepID=UPI0039E48E3C
MADRAESAFENGSAAMTGPLAGIRVLDWTIWQQGPAAGAMLGDLGAEVIKIEERGAGDPGRGMQSVSGLDVTGIENAYFEVHNRNKKSIAVDLKAAEGVALVHRLVEKSDVFLHNFRPGVPERLGLDYDTLSSVRPGLIYAAASAFGAHGPERTARAYDLLGLARSGIMSAAGSAETGEPGVPKGGIADQMGAIGLAYGVLAALVARERLGVGQLVETSLLGSMMWLQALSVQMQLVTGAAAMSGNRRQPANPLWNHYRCADDKWLALAMPQSDRYWADVVALLGRPGLACDPRFEDQVSRREHSAECVELLDELFSQASRDHWLERLGSLPDLPISPVNTLAEVVADPQAAANGYVIEYDHPVRGACRTAGFPLSLSQTPLEVRERAPEFGEHTEAILLELLELDWGDIARLKDAQVI